MACPLDVSREKKCVTCFSVFNVQEAARKRRLELMEKEKKKREQVGNVALSGLLVPWKKSFHVEFVYNHFRVHLRFGFRFNLYLAPAI